MVDIVLVVPPKLNMSIVPPLGLGYLASSLRQEGYKVELFDFVKQRASLNDAADKIIRKNPRFVGLTVLTHYYNTAKELIKLMKQKNSKLKVIIGGVHISALPEFSLQDLEADFAIIGEGEEVISKVIKVCDSNPKNFAGIEGLAYRENGRVKINSGCNIIKDLDALPFPAWDLIAPQSYWDSPGYFSSKGFNAPIIISRGCPHQCSFCVSRLVHSTKIRYRDPENVVDEMEMLVKNFGIQDFDFYDDNFAENKTLAVAVCEEIIKRRLNISWKTPVGIRLDNIDEEILIAMKRSGCYEIGFGIESYSDEVLRLNKKPLDRSRVLEKINLVKKFNIKTMGFFILGLPGDTKKSIRQTMNFAISSPFDLVIFSCAIPFPGTEMFKKIYTEDNFPRINWDKFTFSNQFNTSEVSPFSLRLLLREAFIRCYIKPSRIICLFRIFLRLKILSFLKALKFIFYYIIK